MSTYGKAETVKSKAEATPMLQSLLKVFNIETQETVWNSNGKVARWPKKKHFYIAHKDNGEEYYGPRSHAGKQLGVLLDCRQATYLAEELLKFANEDEL